MTPPKTTSITITVPSDLREKMRGHSELNWSRIASTAFQEAIEIAEYEKANPGVPSKLRELERTQKLQNLGSAVLRAVSEEGLNTNEK